VKRGNRSAAVFAADVVVRSKDRFVILSDAGGASVPVLYLHHGFLSFLAD
jgi:hypothetical protein